jgi:serine/threonine protein kinase
LELEQFSHEFDILCKFNNAGIIKAHKLVPHRHTLFMVLDDFKGICLENIIYQNSLTIKELLGLSIQIADILDQIHQSQIIHKNINPGCFLFNQKTARLIMYDFSIAVEQTQVYQKEISSNMMEGTLHYISPEQTGRLNRGVDFRTDYYSFGVMLYALFTKHLPFEGDDPALLVYSHIAHTPKYRCMHFLPNISLLRGMILHYWCIRILLIRPSILQRSILTFRSCFRILL